MKPGTPPALSFTSNKLLKLKHVLHVMVNQAYYVGQMVLPHLVADGDWAHAPEFIIPGMMFLYTAGWIGWSGRKYLQTVATSKNPTEKEIIIDVPVALKIMISGYLWPATAWAEFVSGNFVAEPEDITVSPR